MYASCLERKLIQFTIEFTWPFHLQWILIFLLSCFSVIFRGRESELNTEI